MNKNWLINLRKSVYLRILTVFSVIMAGILLITVPINMRSLARSQEQYIESTQSKAGFFLDMMGYEMQVAQRQLLKMINDKSLNALATYSKIVYTPTEIRLILDVKANLQAIGEQSRYIKEVTAFLPKLKHKIDTHFSYERFDQPQYASLSDRIEEGHHPFFQLDDRWFTGYGKYYWGREDGEYEFFVAIEWDADQIQQALSSLNTSDDDPSGQPMGGAMFFSGGAGINLFDTSGDTLTHSFLAAQIEGNRAAQGNGRVQYRGSSWIYVWSTSDTLRSRLIVFENEALLNGFLSFYRQSIALIIIVTMLAAAIYAYLTRYYIAKPLRELKESFLRFEREYFNPPVETSVGNDFHLLFAYFRRMVERTDQLIDQLYNQRILTQKAQLKQLQSQINPHFLYNSLLCARSQIKMGDDEGAVDMLRHLASYYEYITREARDEVALSDEIEHARNYVNVQSIRFAHRLTMKFDMEQGGYLQCFVPRLILQPLVENAFTHGFRDKTSNAVLHIRIHDGGASIIAEVEDNGTIPEQDIAALNARLGETAPSAEVSGLINVHRRLVYRFGEASGLSFQRGDLGGLRVTLTIQKEARNV